MIVHGDLLLILVKGAGATVYEGGASKSFYSDGFCENVNDWKDQVQKSSEEIKRSYKMLEVMMFEEDCFMFGWIRRK